MSRRIRSYSSATRDLVATLGLEIARGRRERHMTVAELAERSGSSPATVHRVERGDTSVAVGTALEIGRIAGIRFFGAAPGEEADLVARGRDRLAVLPARVRHPVDDVDNAF